MVEYWYYTGDTTYNAEVLQALMHQVGVDDDYMPANQSKSLVSIVSYDRSPVHTFSHRNREMTIRSSGPLPQ